MKVLIKKSPKAKSGSTLTASKAREILHDGTAHGKPITDKQRRYFGYVAGGGKAESGASLTPLAKNVVQFNGASHEDGGIPMSYGQNKVEVEGGETAYKSPVDNSLHIMGNMQNPLTGRKFKEDSKRLAEKERKNEKLIDYSTDLVNKNDPSDKWKNLSFNAGKVMMEGGIRKRAELAENKEWLATIQKAMLDTANELGADPQSYSKGKLTKAQAGATVPWEYRGTNTQNLDKNILGFVDLLSKKGYTGYSGPQSGFSQRNTKSGRLSRHAMNQALDMFVSQPDAYQKVLKDPELAGYLINNGLTMINEYDPKVAEKTGATAGHLHIGYDKGTGVSDQFRTDAASIYKSTNPTWSWGKTDGPGRKGLVGIPKGDIYDIPKNDLTLPNMKFDPNSIRYPQTTKDGITPKDYPLTVAPETPYAKPSNAKPLSFDQVLPELYTAATNKPEPVWLQQYRPQLFQPYKVSFQDRLNQNQANFNALLKANVHNPAAQSILAGQLYEANNQVLGEEFRTNQGIEADVTNKNIALLNDAQSRNLGLADTQYVRQAQTKAKVKEQNQVILDSISSKLAQNRLENRTLQVLENMYPNYAFDEKNNMKATYYGPSADEWISWGNNDGTNAGGGNTAVVKKYGPDGNLQYTRTNTSSPIKYQLDQSSLMKKSLDLFKEKRGLYAPSIQRQAKYKQSYPLIGVNK